MGQKLIFGFFIATCLVWQVHAVVNCTETGPGRFADPDDNTCRNYTLCVTNTNVTNSYLAYNYVCPTTSLFNPASSLCTAPTNYVCNATVTTTNTPAASVCTADGYIPDPNSTDCSSYIECVQINGAFIETIFTCPPDTFYNPNSTLCESTYVCSVPFTCVTAGRFADTTDTTCQQYFLCVLSGITYLQYTYACPSTSLFNPNSRLCTATYTCTN